tara:strand:+ start:784 stop:1101 length:318 start_codon:yes stop_codon:yes gene_type:complete
MKFKNFVYYKNRKLYCYDKSEYVNFSNVIEYIRNGYQIGVFNIGEDFNQETALLRGNRYIIQNFAKKIDTFSNSTVALLSNLLYKSWNLERQVLQPIQKGTPCEH